jgi:hypothetical protein
MVLVLAMIFVFLASAMGFMRLVVVSFMLSRHMFVVLPRGVAIMMIVFGMCSLLAA